MIKKLELFTNIMRFKKVYIDHLLSLNLFNINENINISKRDIILELLDKNILKTTPKDFLESLSKSKHIKMLSQYTITELSNMELYKVPGYNIGYTLKRETSGVDITLVHNNESDVKNIGNELVSSAIRNGGNKLDHFDTEPLNTIYHNLGFVEIERYPYDAKYDINGDFRNKYGKLDVIYRKLI